MTRILPLSIAAAAAALLSGCVIAPVEPAPPVVVHRPVAVAPAPVIVQPAPVYVRPGYARGGSWRDRDGDGVPNRYDRAPGNPYRY